MRNPTPALAFALTALLICTSGCMGDIVSKAGAGDFGVTPHPTGTADILTPDAEYDNCIRTCSRYTGQEAAGCAGTCCTARCPEDIPGGTGTCREKCVNGVLPVSPTITGVQGTETITRAVPTPDSGCSSTTGCDVYRTCMTECTEKHGVDCETRCCSSRCFDLPAEEKKACADACLKSRS